MRPKEVWFVIKNDAVQVSDLYGNPPSRGEANFEICLRTGQVTSLNEGHPRPMQKALTEDAALVIDGVHAVLQAITEDLRTVCADAVVAESRGKIRRLLNMLREIVEV